MFRPLVLVALAFAAGVWLRVQVPAGGAWVAAGLGLAALVALSGHRRDLLPGGPLVPLLLACVLAGFLYTGVRLGWDRGTVPAWIGQGVDLVGVVADAPDARPGRVGYLIDAERVNDRPARGRVLVADYRIAQTEAKPAGAVDVAPQVRYGDRVRVRGRLDAPRPAGNPGEFDYAAYLARQGVYARISLSDRRSGEDALQVLTGGRAANPLVELALFLRERWQRVLQAMLTPQHAALLAGIFFGARGDLPEQVQEDFRVTGVYHILAVSGSNVAFVAGPIWALAWRAGAGRRLAAALTALAVVFYALLSGLSAPVLRASVMALLALAADVLGRPRDSYSALAAAALLLLLVQPLSLFDAGFQLSFAATVGILALTPRLEQRLQAMRWTGRWPGWVRTGLAVTVAAQLAVLPISLEYFTGVSVISLVANLVALPLVGVLVGLAALICLLGMLWQPLAWPLAGLAGILAGLLVGSMSLLARVPFAFWHAAPWPAPATLLYAAGLAALAGWWRLPSGSGRWWLMGAASLATVAWTYAGADPPGTLRVTFLDVGQGDAIAIKFPNGKWMLVDGGGRPEYGEQQAEMANGAAFDPGRRVVVPFLRRQGARELEAVVLTHPHADHVGGLRAVVEELPVRRVYFNPAAHTHPYYRQWLELVDQRRVPAVPLRAAGQLSASQPASVDSRVTLRVLGPPGASAFYGTRSDLNNNSIVVMLEYGEFRLLLTGDLEREAEAHLLEQYGTGLRSTVLKVAHHGSTYATGEQFLRTNQPAVAVISVGPNAYGLPSRATLQRLQRQGVTVYRTDQHGAVTIKTDGRGMAVQPFRPGVPPTRPAPARAD